MKTIRAILIDPHTKSVSEIAMKPDFEAMKRDLLKCDMAQAVDLGQSEDGTTITAWVDENGLLVDDWSQQGFTRIMGGPIFAGYIVFTGMREGDMASLPADITVPFVNYMVQFMPPKKVRVPGPTLTTFDADGTAHTEPLGPEWLTFDNH